MMKKFLIFFYTVLPLISSASEFPLVPIYQPPKTQTTTKKIPFDEFIAIIDNTINAKYSRNILLDLFTPFTLTQENARDICDTVKYYHGTAPIQQATILRLCRKNSFFSSALDQYISLAKDALEHVTLDTMDAVQNASLTHPKDELNQLPFEIKEYVIKKAQEVIKHKYEMVIKDGDKEILCHDICSANDTLALGIEKTIRIWCLKTIAFIKQLSLKHRPYELSFNNDGSLIAANEKSQLDDFLINIYSTLSKELLHTIEPTSFLFYRLHFLSDSSQNILSIMEYEDTMTPVQQTLFLIEDNREPYHVGSLPMHPNNNAHEDHEKDKYSSILGRTGTVYCTKKNCHDLYLCLQAIKSSTRKDAKKIPLTTQYQQLTPYEHTKVQTKIQEHIGLLRELSQQTSKRISTNVVLLHRSQRQPCTYDQFYYTAPQLITTQNKKLMIGFEEKKQG